MKAFLMFPDRDFDLQQPLPWNEPALVQDLELTTLFNAMAQGDKFLFEVIKRSILTGIGNSPEVILYRQAVLKDCLNNAALVRSIYDIAVAAIDAERKNYMPIFGHYPQYILDRSLEVVEMFFDVLKKLRMIADQNIRLFDSQGFIRLFQMLQRELDDAYFLDVQTHLKELKFRHGVFISAELGKGLKGANYVLRKPNENNQGWVDWVFAKRPQTYSYTIADRDEAGAKALGELKDRGINLAANALAQSADHILSFINMLRAELAFYIGCMNLQNLLAQKGEPVAFPVPVAAGEQRLSFRGLYDVSLSLTLPERVVGSDLNADQKTLFIITGANQGGKSTFLRSIGLAQLMMQCGMFVPADAFTANVCDGLFTHYKREEDTTMTSGKLDEELSRMSEIVNHITPNALLLFNESFAATNEREGSEIASQITRALLEKGLKIFFVTHLYEFARGLYAKHLENAIFLRAERQENGTRTFKIVPGEPLQTSFGIDVYQKVFHQPDPHPIGSEERQQTFQVGGD